MKKLLVGCGMVTLVGCSGFSTLFTFSDMPVVRESTKQGATKQQILSVGGKYERDQAIRNGQGSCVDYVLHKNGKSSPFYVAFNQQDLLKNYGFITCNDADARGFLRSDEAMRQIY